MARSAAATPRPACEPSFEWAQKRWSRMRRPVTFTGVPGHPFQPAVLWNTGLLFCPAPDIHRADGALNLAGPPGFMRELEGREADGLHIEFSFGAAFHIPDRLDNKGGEVSQELLEGRMPVVLSRFRHKGLVWTCTVFSRLSHGGAAQSGDEPLLTEVHWRVHNPAARPLRAQLACHLTAPHIALGYKIALREKACRYTRALRWENGVLLDDRRKARLSAAAVGAGEVEFRQELSEKDLKKAETALMDMGLARDVLVYGVGVPPGGSAALRMVVPFFAVEPEVLEKAARTGFNRALARTRTYWRRELSRSGTIATPERIVNDTFDACLYHAMLATGRKARTGQWILKTSPNRYEGLWGAHAAIAAFSMDLRGKHEWSRKVFDCFLENQRPIPQSILSLSFDLPGTRSARKPARRSEGFSPHPGFLGNIEGHMAVLWTFYHGWTMWAIGRHARLTRDWKWFRRNADRLALACEWIAQQRRRTKLRDSKGRRALSWGLLPASNAFDWGFGHMFWSDAHTYRGLREIAECLDRVRHPGAGRFLREAESYRRDIVKAVTRCRDASRPVPLDDGSTIPFVPMSVEMRDFFAPDWTYAACGPLNLAWAGVVAADHELIDQTLAFLEAGRPRGGWLADAKKYEGWDWAARAEADEDFLEATRPKKGRAYFWRHGMTYEPGWIPQAFVFMERDDTRALFEHFYSLISNGGQHVELRSPVEQRDGVVWTQPGDANLMWLIRNMLACERGSTLILAGACPRAWLAGGGSIGVKGLVTDFGKVTYRIKGHPRGDRVTGSFSFDLAQRPRRILLRLRHPGGAPPKLVRLDGRGWVAGASEWITMPPGCRRLEARY